MVFTVSYDTARQESSGVRGGGKNALPHNNGMHPTADSAAFIRQLEGLLHCVRGG